MQYQQACTGSQLLLLLLLAVSAATGAAAAPRPGQCTQLVQQYMSEHTSDFKAKQDVNKFTFFLHVPRTAGKTYANCFLRSALPPSKRCAKSYDVLRYNVSADSCRTIVSHDDFSVSQFLPPEAATITQLRRPIDRVISAYEFAVDIAAKGVQTPDQRLRRPSPKAKPDFVGTLDVWPWSYLIPYFKQDMNQRMAALRESALNDSTAWRDYLSPANRTYYWNEAKNKSVWVLPESEAVLDPYNNSLVIPLHEWLESPIAEELIHNGAALQVLGLTNYSYWGGHAELRACLRSNSIAREMLLTLATKRLRSMAHVGLTEQLDASVTSLAADLGISFRSKSYKYTSGIAFSYDGGTSDDAEPITFNSTLDGGVNVTLPRGEATARFLNITSELHEIRVTLDELTPLLSALVRKEAQWLEEQEALLEAAAAANATGSGLLGRALAAGRRTVAALSGPASSLWQLLSALPSRIAARQWQTVRRGQSVVVPEAAEVDHGGAGPGEGSGSTEPLPEGEDEAGDVGKIDSEWSQEIEEMDDRVSRLQQRRKVLDEEMHALQHSGILTPAEEATGKARQVLPDHHFEEFNRTLAQAYRHCADSGTDKKSGDKPYSKLRTPWGETFRFSREARSQLPAKVISRIHQLNLLDEELWKVGEAMLKAKLAEQHEAGMLETLERAPPAPPAPKPPPPRPGARKRRLVSEQRKDKKKTEEEARAAVVGGGNATTEADGNATASTAAVAEAEAAAAATTASVDAMPGEFEEVDEEYVNAVSHDEL